MSLLEVIAKASAQPDPECDYPVVLDAEPVFPNLKPEGDGPTEKTLVKRASGWQLSQVDSEVIELNRDFFNKLKRKLKNPSGFERVKFLEMLNSYLESIRERNGISVNLEKSDEGYTAKLVEKVGFLMGRNVKALVLEACVVFEDWEVLNEMIVNGVVEHSSLTSLVNNLIEKRRSDLIVFCVKHLVDLQAFDIMCVLKYFLSPPVDGLSSMVSLREDWESQALLAIEKASDNSSMVSLQEEWESQALLSIEKASDKCVSGKKSNDKNLKKVKSSDKSVSGKKSNDKNLKKVVNLAKDASMFIMLAYDGFSASELCLHYLLASKNLDEVILSACISKLDGSEVVSLVKYLGKWLKKYERFPQVGPCPKVASVLGLKVCQWIPTLEDVVKCLGLVVDEHFSSLVLQMEFVQELKSLEGVVASLAAEARLCGTIANLTDSLTTKHKGA